MQVTMAMAGESKAVRWVLYCSVTDGNWKSALQRLTNEEIGYCLARIKKKTGRKALQRLAHKRGLALDAAQTAAAQTKEGGDHEESR